MIAVRFPWIGALGPSILGGLAVLYATQAQAPPTFRIATNIVQFDVTVLGPDQRPLHGLTRDDFTLLEEGVEKEILGFGEVTIPDAADAPAWVRDETPDVRTALDGRVLIFLLDDALTPHDTQTLNRVQIVKRLAGEVIDRMGPTDVAAVLCTFDTRCAQDFTSDRQLLKQSIGRFTPKMFPMGAVAYHWDRQASGTAGSLAKYLADLVGRRKAIIYVTPRQPSRPLIWPPIASRGSLEANVSEQATIRAFESAIRAMVTVYTLDSAGLLPLIDRDSTKPLPGLVSLQAQRRLHIDANGNSTAPVPEGPTRFTGPPRSLSFETGGFTVSRPSEFMDGVTQIFRETGSYYLLGYEPSPDKTRTYNMLSGFRSVEVRVKRPDVQIRSHQGLIPVSRPSGPEAPKSAASALAGILPDPGLPLRVAVAPFATVDSKNGRFDTTLAIVLGIQEPAASSPTADRLEVEFRAFTQRGDARATSTQRVDVTIPRSPHAAYAEVLAELPLKPGLYALRFSADSKRLGQRGSVYSDVEIPDFANAPLSMSGVMLAVNSGPVPTPRDLFAKLAPIVPTTTRDLNALQVATAFLRIYEKRSAQPRPVLLTTTMLNEIGGIVNSQTDTIEADRFVATRSVDFQYRVPSATLPGGRYLVRFEAKTGTAAAKRSLQIVIK